MSPRARRTFLTGLFIVLPLLITFWVVQFVVYRIDAAVSPLMLQVIRLLGAGQWMEMAWVNYVAPVFSVALAVLLIYMLGLVGGNVLGRQLIKGVEHILLQIPVVRGIYSGTRQFLDTFSNAKGSAFRRAVLVEYPRPGVWSLGFLTNDTEGEVQESTGRDVVCVFIPTTPNPTSGWLAFVPKNDVIQLTMTVDDAFKMIISGGVLSPVYPPIAGETATPSAPVPPL